MRVYERPTVGSDEQGHETPALDRQAVRIVEQEPRFDYSGEHLSMIPVLSSQDP